MKKQNNRQRPNQKRVRKPAKVKTVQHTPLDFSVLGITVNAVPRSALALKREVIQEIRKADRDAKLARTAANKQRKEAGNGSRLEAERREVEQ